MVLWAELRYLSLTLQLLKDTQGNLGDDALAIWWMFPELDIPAICSQTQWNSFSELTTGLAMPSQVIEIQISALPFNFLDNGFSYRSFVETL
jgi:hypothetical protein